MRPLVYLVEHLDGRRSERVHSARLHNYEALFDNATIPQDVLNLAYITEVRYEILHRIVDLCAEDGDLWLRLEWDGLLDELDWTWSRFQDVYEYVPDMLTVYLHNAQQDSPTLDSQAARLLGISLSAPS